MKTLSLIPAMSFEAHATFCGLLFPWQGASVRHQERLACTNIIGRRNGKWCTSTEHTVNRVQVN